MIHASTRRFGRGSILALTALLIGFVLLQPRLFDDDTTNGTRNLPRASGPVSTQSVAAPADAATSQPPADHGTADPSAPSPEVLAAVEQLSGRLQANPHDADAWIELGGLLLEANDPMRASEAYAAALEADAERTDARALLGKSLLFAGQLRLARAELERALAIDGTMAEAQLNLGITYSHSAPPDITAARAAWTRASELAPGTAIAAQADEYLVTYAEPASGPRG